MQLFLDATLVQQTCIFKLSWGGKQLPPAQVPYSETLTLLYEDWQYAYLDYYYHHNPEDDSTMRATAEIGMGDMPEFDRRKQLVEAEIRLLAEFNLWLESAKLNKIRSTISSFTITPQIPEAKSQSAYVDLFITCHSEDASIDLAQLPWEAWEVGQDLPTAKPLRIARTPASIQAELVKRRHRSRFRVLAIFGDEARVNFKNEKDSLELFNSRAEVVLLDWKSRPEGLDIKEMICAAIVDPEGWDVLFFAGHSSGTKLTQGELEIAPGEVILVREIAPQLRMAKEHGLQFAIFNSCEGLSIANALIDLGLSQVAVMREKIHSNVAEEFLVSFVQAMLDHKDVHEAMMFACDTLKAKKALTYPSAHLIPSLFRHPDSQLFQIPPRWWEPFKPFFPNRREAIAWGLFSILSLISPLQDAFIQFRQVAQANYSALTRRIPSKKPDILLVQIDQESVKDLDANKVYPIDRTYLAKLMARIRAPKSTLKPKVIGIDYYFSNPKGGEDEVLKREIEQALQERIKVVLATDEESEFTLTPTIAPLTKVLQGYANAYTWYVELPKQGCRDSNSCPFAFSIANALPREERLSLNGVESLPITNISHLFGQKWLQPIIDFSVPPTQAYRTTTAAKLLTEAEPISEAIVVIAPGNYREAGVGGRGEDIFDPPPLPVSVWRSGIPFTGGEFHTYMIDHFLTLRLVVPIPDLWMIALAALLGKGIILIMQRLRYSQKRKMILITSSNVLWIALALEIYQTGAILIPLALPLIVFWIYVLPTMRRKRYAN